MTLHVLNLGAGVQSTTIYLMALDGDLPEYPITHAIFADTQDEPEGVYRHLEWLKTLDGPKILTGTIGRLGDDLVKGVTSTGADAKRFASIPAFTKHVGEDKVGMTRRQCTSEYKIQVVEQIIRRELLGLKPRQRKPKDVTIVQYMGFSMDEPGRAGRARGRFEQRGWSQVEFPLFEPLQMTRHDCERYLADRVPHLVPKSACVFCPYKSNASWREMKTSDPKAWRRAVEVDAAIRDDPKYEAELFVHRSGKPLADANLDENQGEFDFMAECEGGCGL